MDTPRRRFQFSLRATIMAMILAGVAIGVFVRWPYYVAGRVLDEADGDKSSPLWTRARQALINDERFRVFVRAPHNRMLYVVSGDRDEGRVVAVFTILTSFNVIEELHGGKINVIVESCE